MKDELLIIDRFAAQDDAVAVIDAFMRCRFEYTHRVDGFFDHRVMWASAFPTSEVSTRKILRRWAEEARCVLQTFFEEPAIYCDGIQTVVWPTGMAMPLHQDDRHPDPLASHQTPWRFLASLIYLNDDYEGGEIYFPQRHRTVKPIQGQLIAFPGVWWHGVHTVKAGVRYTAPAWYSRSALHEDAFLK